MKVNQLHQQEQEKTFEEELSFAEWLDYFQKEPTTQELNAMEKYMSKTHKQYHHPLNNTNYQPLQGA